MALSEQQAIREALIAWDTRGARLIAPPVSLSRPAPDNALLFACGPQVRRTRRALNALTMMVAFACAVGFVWWIALALGVGGAR